MAPLPTIPADPAGILLVEDDEVLGELLVGHLHRRGHVVLRCATAGDAIAALSGGLRPALIVLDINLPDAAGWTVTRDPAYAAAGAPPVVVASAVTLRATSLADEGVAGYLPKPFPLRTFMDVVERYVGLPDGGADTEVAP